MYLSYLTMLMAAPQAEGQEPSSPLLTFLPFVVIAVAFYFIFIRPQSKKQKEHEQMLSALQKGERVMTSGGLIGTVVGVGQDTITLRFGDNFKAEVGKAYIVGKMEG